MMPSERSFEIEDLSDEFASPILIASSVVGRGNFTIGEAIKERLENDKQIYHLPIEELTSPEVVREDLARYKYISNNYPWLLYLVYKVPIFYYRKYLRERLFAAADLTILQRKIEDLGIKTVICVSHRPAFWVAALKRRMKSTISVWGLLAEFGKNLGWKYQFWDQINGFLSPIDQKLIGFNLPQNVKFRKLNLPVKAEYQGIASAPGDLNNVLFVCGYWGQGPFVRIVEQLLGRHPHLRLHVVCGENEGAYKHLTRRFGRAVNVYGVVSSLAPLIQECASIITKPGMSTLLEARAAQRQIFLLKGMPVAEDNNARFAIEHFGAKWFEINQFYRWLESSQEEINSDLKVRNDTLQL